MSEYDWKELEKLFRELNDGNYDGWLDYQWGVVPKIWSVTGFKNTSLRSRFYALSKIAGLKLMGLLDLNNQDKELKEENDPTYFWFLSLKLFSGEFNIKTPFEQINNDGKSLGWSFHGRLNNVSDVSANMCLHYSVAFFSEQIERNKNEKKKGSDNIEDLLIFNEREIWQAIKTEFDYSKNKFGRKIKFISDSFKRKIIFRDIAQSYFLMQRGCFKPSVILAGGVIEELLKSF